MRNFVKILILFCVGCISRGGTQDVQVNSENSDTTFFSWNQVNSLMGLDESYQNNNDHFIEIVHRISLSQPRDTISKFVKLYYPNKIDTVFIDSLYCLYSKEDDPILNTLVFILNDYYDNLGPDRDINRWSMTKNIENKILNKNLESNSRYAYLRDLYFGYGILEPFNSGDYQLRFSELSKICETYKNSKRLKFILGVFLEKNQQFQSAIPYFKELCSTNYYKYQCEIHLANCYLSLNNDSSKLYLTKLDDDFPLECNLLKLKNEKPNLSYYITKCEVCLNNGTQRDSIVANVFIGRELLLQKKYIQFDELASKYNYNSYSIDSLKKWERNEWYSMNLESLLAQSKYNLFCDFINSKSNSYYNIDDEEELKEYLNQYFFKTNNTNNLQDFEIWYNRNFDNCVKHR